MAFSNTIDYALRETIKEFNDFLYTKANVNKYTAVDFHNAFYQRLRKNLMGTADWAGHGISCLFGAENVLLGEIKEGRLQNFKFVETNRYNTSHKEMIQKFNEILSGIDVLMLGSELPIYVGASDQLSESINKIRNFKVN